MFEVAALDVAQSHFGMLRQQMTRANGEVVSNRTEFADKKQKPQNLRCGPRR